MSERYVLGLGDIDAAQVALAGGKGANLGELRRIGGVAVPPGFCVTTGAFEHVVLAAPGIGELRDRLARLGPGDRETIGTVSAEIRSAIEAIAIPGDVAAQITAAVGGLGEGDAYAVRSSATAEDLPGASFAGQQDTYLNVTGPDAVLDHVRRCWASLFTDRAVAYRERGGFGHDTVRMAVVVQRMVAAKASGVLFTADPVSGHRKIVSVEAVPGLGEALVSGQVNPDVYQVRDGEIITREPQGEPVLTDGQVRRLAELGRRIEAHFGRPQDIEWCLADGDAADGAGETGGEFAIVQARPVTTLFPVPEAGDDGNHVYVSVGHQQMFTDAMKPLGISMWQAIAGRPMHEAGGRLFVDVTRDLASPATRDIRLKVMREHDPLIGDALQSVVDRGDFLPDVPADDPEASPRTRGGRPAGTLAQTTAGGPGPIDADPAFVTELIERFQGEIEAVRRDIAGKTGPELLDFIAADLKDLRQSLFDPRSMQVIMAVTSAVSWLNQHLREWLGEQSLADTLARSAPGNVTAEMGLALLDVADAIRPYPEVVAFLEQHVLPDQAVPGSRADPGFLEELPSRPGGREARDAIGAFLTTYGMRCAGEIDITRPRWAERPATLVPVLLGNVANFGPGAAKERFEQGLRKAARQEQDLLNRLRDLPDGEARAADAKRRIDQVRAFAGYREYPKYYIVSRFFVYKRALLAEADRLVAAGVLENAEDIFYLRLEELSAVVRAGAADDGLISRRRGAFGSYEVLTPPRVLTSDGEAVTGSYRRDGVPAGSLAGLAVSAGTVEGRARVVLDMAAADLGADDILVTAYTDPSWTPAFVAIKGLVTEVGGLMTHGAVIAREYGLPAVVGVEHATTLIRDGQRIRVHGTDGYVEILS